MTRPSPAHPELLAPAGNLEAFFAALESGADAVYLGLQEFSARAKAKNFSLGELERMLAYARHHDRKLFVTLNTLIKEHELPQLVETLAALESLQVDAVILQDLAVWRLARNHFPDLELHASTQLTIHNAAGVRQLERMGFTRGVLARELTLEEIADIRRETTLELEHFIHGALCFSFSGQCMFSSWLGGKSGNRGRCAQPCRRRYHQRGKDGYYFSPNDLSAIDLLPELAAAGVCSFKIEGRMKSAEYVANVVSAYRTVLAAPAAERPAALATAKEQLRNALGRPPTRGFLTGTDPTDIAISGLSGATGRYLGEIARAAGDRFTLRIRDKLHVGDRLRVQPRSDQAGTAFTLRQIFLGPKSVKVASSGATVSVVTPFRDRFSQGDAVFKVATDQAKIPSAAVGRRRLERLGRPPRRVTLQLSLAEGELHLRAESLGVCFEESFPVDTFAAEHSPLTSQTLENVFTRTGETPLQLATLRVAPLPPVVIPPSRLKEIRRAFYSHLSHHLDTQLAKRRAEKQQAALASLAQPLPPVPVDSPQIRCMLRDGRELQLLQERAVDGVILPLVPSVANPLLSGDRRNLPVTRILWELPMVLLGSRAAETRRLLEQLIHAGFRRFRLSNLGHFSLFDGLPPVRLETGFRLFTLNSEAVRAWRDLGAERCELYLEDDRDNIRRLLAQDRPVPLGATVFAPVPLLTSRIRIRGLPQGGTVTSDRDEAFRIDSRHGLTLLRPVEDFSLVGHLRELRSFGCSHFTLDLSHLGAFSPRARAVLEALRLDRPLAQTRPFNYLHGME